MALIFKVKNQVLNNTKPKQKCWICVGNKERNGYLCAMKNYFDTIPEGGCIAKKTKKKLTMIYVKRVYPRFRDWGVDIIEITEAGASLYENQMWSPSYSDGYRKADAQCFLKMRTILKMTWVAVSPLKEKFIESMQK